MNNMETAPRNGTEVTILADLAPFDDRPFESRAHYDAMQGWVVKREFIGRPGYELLNVNALGWRPQ